MKPIKQVSRYANMSRQDQENQLLFFFKKYGSEEPILMISKNGSSDKCIYELMDYLPQRTIREILKGIRINQFGTIIRTGKGYLLTQDSESVIRFGRGLMSQAISMLTTSRKSIKVGYKYSKKQGDLFSENYGDDTVAGLGTAIEALKQARRNLDRDIDENDYDRKEK